MWHPPHNRALTIFLNALHTCYWMLQLLHLAATQHVHGVTWWHYQVYGRKGSVPNINKLSYKHRYMYESTDDTPMYRSNSLTLVKVISKGEKPKCPFKIQDILSCTIWHSTFTLTTHFRILLAVCDLAVHQVDNPVHRSNTSLMAMWTWTS